MRWGVFIWPQFAFRTFQPSYILRKFDFQTNILKESHNNDNEVQEYNILLSISTAAAIFHFLLSDKRDQFLVVSQNIYVCSLKFGNRCYFKHLNFYGHEFFRTVSGNCFRVTFISGRENHKSHEKLSFIFSISIKLFHSFKE